ncbi:MAG: VanZ family protein [Gemmataceae bacterium]|nr:VanZ family protein [Gemmataceae bacterium]MCI0740137.1 VanZ family protein [Gemmataceae bacterium]
MSKRRWLIWSFYVALWTVALLLPPEVPEAIVNHEIIRDRKFLIGKTVHIVAFAVMTILTGWLRSPPRWRLLLLAFLLVHPTVTELLQLEVGRTGLLTDVALDQVGVALGLALSWKWWFENTSASG